MKTKDFAVLYAVSLVFLSSTFGEDVRYAFLGAGRYHAENEFTPVAFDDGEWSYLVGLEVYEGAGYWQLAVDFADGGGTGTVSSTITPQINLNVSDSGAIIGIGMLCSYVEDEVLGNEWSDIYFQLNGGLDLELGDSLSLLAVAHFTFEDFSDVGEINFDLLDYTVGFNYKF